MKDTAHELTDELLEQTEKEMIRLYQAAQKDINKKLLDALDKMEGGATEQIRFANANKYDRLKKLEEQIADILSNSNQNAVKLLQGAWYNTYSINYNFASYWIESTINELGIFPLLDQSAIVAIVKGELTPFSLMAIDNIEDKAQIVRDLTTQLVNGITQGESSQAISRRIRGVVEKNYSQSMMIARTETNRIESNGRYDAMKYGQDKYNIKQNKKWTATKDGDTRNTHRRADGQIVSLEENFKVGKAKGLYPGEMDRAEESIQCRCTHVPIIIGFEDKEPVMNYDEWEKTRDGMTANQIAEARRKAKRKE